MPLLLLCLFWHSKTHEFDFGIIYSGDTESWVDDPSCKFKQAYSYLAGSGPSEGVDWVVQTRVGILNDNSFSNTFILTFYRLLMLGDANGCTGSHEADRVKCCLENPDLMKTYFEEWQAFCGYLNTAKESYPDMNIILHSEPDSWGFMWWAMGVEGESNPRNVRVEVASTGLSELAGLEDNAVGLSQALIYYARTIAPDVKLAFHASNFRVGTRPDVVYDFINAISIPNRWDILFTEDAHWKYPEDDSTFYIPWNESESGVIDNLNWIEEVTTETDLKLALWQAYPGPLDYNLLGNYPTDDEYLTALISRNVVGVMFHIESGDLTNWRYYAEPPVEYLSAGGTGGDVKSRIENYYLNPIDIDDPFFNNTFNPIPSGVGTGIMSFFIVFLVFIINFQ